MLFYENHKVYMDGSYPAIFLNGKNVHIHRLEWQKHNGNIPKGYVIHHKDENKLNWNINNLELLSRADHVREHRDKVHRPGIVVIASKGNISIKFNSIKEAALVCGTYPSSLRRCFIGEQKKANGWAFERVGDPYSVL